MPIEYEGFEWDENKRLSNLGKHSIDFRDAPALFYGVWLCVPAQTTNGEQRFMAIGTVNGHIVTFIYTERERARICRIISARRASKNEQKNYRLFFSRSTKTSG